MFTEEQKVMIKRGTNPRMISYPNGYGGQPYKEQHAKTRPEGGLGRFTFIV